MYDFEKYYEAESLEHAKALLDEHPSAKIIAGGSDLLVHIREYPEPGMELLGLHKVKELKHVTLESDGTIRIGAMMTFDKLETNSIIKKWIPILGEAGGTIGGPQLRRTATIGGNVCNGAVSADSATSLFALNAEVVLESAKGKRVSPIKEFYLGPGRTDVKTGEILTEILIKKADYEHFGGHYIKFSQRKALDIATLGTAVICKLQDNATIAELRIALGVAAPTPVRCEKAEAFAKGMTLTSDNILKVGELALEDANPRDSWRGSKAYRQQLIKVNTQRALEKAATLIGGEINE